MIGARRPASTEGLGSWDASSAPPLRPVRARLARPRAPAQHHNDLFQALPALLRPGGGVAVITNGTPLWLQDSDWSQALRRFLDQWLGTTTSATCGTDTASQQRYRDSLTAAGYDVQEASVDYSSDLNLEQLTGSIYSALPARQLPTPDQRPLFAEQVRHALQPHGRFTEHIHVAMILGHANPGDQPT